MASTVKKAAKGNRRAMTLLFEKSKDEMYALACVLLDDKQKATRVVVDAFGEMWEGLSHNSPDDEQQFKQKMIVSVANRCRSILFSVGNRNPKIDKILQLEPPEYQNENYMGSIKQGLNQLQSALKNVDPHQRFIYILYFAGGLDFKTISGIVKQREAAVKYSVEIVSIFLADNIDKYSDGKLTYSKIPSLLQKALAVEVLSTDAVSECETKIAEKAVPYVLPKKIWIPALCIFVCVAILVVFVSIPHNTATTSTTSTSSTSLSDLVDDQTSAVSAAAEDNLYTPTLLNESLVYYADIDISNYGKITFKLNQSSAPITAANFVELAQSGFYNGLTFHRIIEDFMMQGGDPNGDGTGGADYNIKGEFTANGVQNTLSHTRGAVSMARSNDYNSASSQFFIMHQDYTSLDGNYAVFGYVTEGMDIVDTICQTAEPTDSNGSIESASQPVIKSVTIRTE